MGNPALISMIFQSPDLVECGIVKSLSAAWLPLGGGKPAGAKQRFRTCIERAEGMPGASWPQSRGVKADGHTSIAARPGVAGTVTTEECYCREETQK